MNDDCISLPLITSGREYIIEHISDDKETVDKLSGYGLSVGARIKLIFSSPFNDPRAYEVMGAVIALRCEDSKDIFVISDAEYTPHGK